MPRREKIIVAVLALVFAFSIGQLLISKIKFPISSEKGVFAEGIIGRIQNLNPLFIDYNDTDRDLSGLIFSGLMRYDPVAKNFFPDLATDWDKTSNGITYTFNLRADAVWHDGEPVTPEDVLFTFKDVIQDPGFKNPLLKNTFEGVTVNKTSQNTVTFTLTKPNSYFISYLTLGILPKHVLKDVPIASMDKANFRQRPVGSGPYKVTGLNLDKDGDYIDLTAFPQYYGTSTKPMIERMRFFTFPDEQSLMEHKSALHSIGKLGASNPSIQEILKDDRFAAYHYFLNQFTAVYLNSSNLFLKDKRVRQALALGLNKQALVMAGEKRVDSLDLLDHSQEEAFAYNQEAAAKALDNLGLKTGAEGFRTNNKGEKMSLNLLAAPKIPKTAVENLRNQWQTLGVQINTISSNSKTFVDLVSERRYDILFTKQSLGYNRDVYPLFHSSQIADGGQSSGLNFSNFKSFRTDGLTEAMRKEKDPKDKEKLLIELSKVIADEVPVIFVSTPAYAYIIDKRAQPFSIDSLDFHSDRLSILTRLSFPNL